MLGLATALGLCAPRPSAKIPVSVYGNRTDGTKR
jgi:hypothetical protein